MRCCLPAPLITEHNEAGKWALHEFTAGTSLNSQSEVEGERVLPAASESALTETTLPLWQPTHLLGNCRPGIIIIISIGDCPLSLKEDAHTGPSVNSRAVMMVLGLARIRQVLIVVTIIISLPILLGINKRQDCVRLCLCAIAGRAQLGSHNWQYWWHCGRVTAATLCTPYNVCASIKNRVGHWSTEAEDNKACRYI